MQQNKLMELTPDKWGLLVYLGDHGAVDLTTVRRFMKDVAESRLAIAEDNLSVAEKLLEIGLSNRTVIHKSYYSMHHAARSAVYLQMQIDVTRHRSLVDKFKKLLIKKFGDETLAKQMNVWRMDRIKCDYDPNVEVAEDMCESAISDASMIIGISAIPAQSSTLHSWSYLSNF
nr:hypothetical protein GAHJGAJJ_00001 [Methanosarcinales archaeon ANME-2c ERB4]